MAAAPPSARPTKSALPRSSPSSGRPSVHGRRRGDRVLSGDYQPSDPPAFSSYPPRSRPVESRLDKAGSPPTALRRRDSVLVARPLPSEHRLPAAWSQQRATRARLGLGEAPHAERAASRPPMGVPAPSREFRPPAAGSRPATIGAHGRPSTWRSAHGPLSGMDSSGTRCLSTARAKRRFGRWGRALRDRRVPRRGGEPPSANRTPCRGHWSHPGAGFLSKTAPTSFRDRPVLSGRVFALKGHASGTADTVVFGVRAEAPRWSVLNGGNGQSRGVT